MKFGKVVLEQKRSAAGMPKLPKLCIVCALLMFPVISWLQITRSMEYSALIIYAIYWLNLTVLNAITAKENVIRLFDITRIPKGLRTSPDQDDVWFANFDIWGKLRDKCERKECIKRMVLLIGSIFMLCFSLCMCGLYLIALLVK